jgi:putative transposase
MRQPDTYYHIYNRANGDENLFRTEENYLYFLKRYADMIYPVADNYAYCLMPNYFHFLVKIRDLEAFKTFPKFQTLLHQIFQVSENLENLSLEEEQVFTSKYISQQFSNLFNTYTKSFNKVYNRNGSLCQKNFKFKKVNHNAYFTTLIHYIHSNPVHHGFCKNLTDWPHSSFESILSEKKSLLKKEKVLGWFGGNNDYISFHNRLLRK